MENETLFNNTTTMTTDMPLIYMNSTVIYTLPFTSVVTLVYCIIGLIANALVIIVILWGSLRSSVFMTVLLALAIADNLTLVAKILIQDGIFGYGLLQGSATMSAWLTVLASAERMVAICYPLNFHVHCNIKKIYICFAAFSILIIIGSAPQFFISMVSLRNDETTCNDERIKPTVLYNLQCSFLSVLQYHTIYLYNHTEHDASLEDS